MAHSDLLKLWLFEIVCICCDVPAFVVVFIVVSEKVVFLNLLIFRPLIIKTEPFKCLQSDN